MFQQYHLISPTTDAGTRFTRSTDWQFAADVPQVSVTNLEVEMLAPEYTLVFSATAPARPVALLGIDGKNRYVTADGRWAATKVPARLRVFPFGTANADDGKTYIVRDAQAPHFSDADGSPLYDEAGKPTTLLNLVSKLAQELHTGLEQGERLAAQLDEAGLLMDAAMTLKLADGSTRNIVGFKAVNEERLAALDEASRSRLSQSGAMGMLLAHQQSLQNITRLLPATTDAAAPAAAKKPRKPRAKKAE